MSTEMSKEQHLQINQAAWDSAHRVDAERMRNNVNWGDEFNDGGVTFDETEIELLGEISDVEVLQLSCGGDASQAFSLANMGAVVTACDFSPVAIEAARENAGRIGLDVRFVVDDSQRLTTFQSDAFDLVHADWNLWHYEDLPLACSNWYRVLKAGGRLLLHEGHPITTWCLSDDEENDRVRVVRRYDDRTPKYSLPTDDDAGALGKADPELKWAEFPHTMADIINAIVESGFLIERMVERVRDRPNSVEAAVGSLPSDFFIIARKVG